MRVFQLVLSIITLLMVLGLFGFNLWIGANFSKGLALPQCYTPLNIITTALVLLTMVTIYIRK
jgi:purine-cytosine permease-like protein